jgi:hypothetical protein
MVAICPREVTPAGGGMHNMCRYGFRVCIHVRVVMRMIVDIAM